MSINTLGISELKWTGMSEFNSDDHYIYYCRQDSLRRNGVAIIVNKSPKCNTWVHSQKQQNDLGLFPRQTIQHHSNLCDVYNLSLCPTTDAKELKLNSSMKTTTPSRTNTRKKRCPFHHRGLECRIRKSRDTWSNSKVWP